MKLGTENKKETILAAVLVVIAVFLVARTFRGGGQDIAAPQPVPAQQAAPGRATPKMAQRPHVLLAHSLDPTLRFDLLQSSEDVTYKGNGRNIFNSEPPPPPAPIPSPNPSPIVNTPPPPPPSGLKFYGFAGPRNGARRIFLLKGEDIFLAKEGDIVDRRYKVVHVGSTSVEIQDVLTNHTETIPLGAG